MQLSPGKHISAYYPQVHQTLSNALDNNIMNMSSQHTVNYVLGRGGVRSIIISSLIFLTVYAWVDVFTQFYKDLVLSPATTRESGLMESFGVDPLMHVMHMNQTNPHRFRKPKSPNMNLATELNIKQKIGYALLLTLFSVAITSYLISY